MIQRRYELMGTILIILLAGGWIVSAIHRRRYSRSFDWRETQFPGIRDMHDVEHRALVYVMVQRTDSILAALARTIEEERQKLGAIVRNPSMDGALVARQADTLVMRPGSAAISEKAPQPASSGATVRSASADGPATPGVFGATAAAGVPESSSMPEDPSAASIGGADSSYDRIVQLADAGMDIPAIARRLKLPEGEVSMVVRLCAA